MIWQSLKNICSLAHIEQGGKIYCELIPASHILWNHADKLMCT